ncbi:MAG: hypothetical protein ACOYK6_00335 [Chthoniobacterales bacterium]
MSFSNTKFPKYGAISYSKLPQDDAKESETNVEQGRQTSTASNITQVSSKKKKTFF